MQLRREGKTQTGIAEMLGVSQKTISNWLGEVSNFTNVELPDTITDTKGRTQPAMKPRQALPEKEYSSDGSFETPKEMPHVGQGKGRAGGIYVTPRPLP